VRLVVARDHQGKGAGLVMLRELVNIAHEKGVEIITAQTFEDADKGVGLFKRLGFRIEAVLSNFAKDIEGNRKNLMILVRDAEELWQEMEDLLLDSDWRGDS